MLMNVQLEIPKDAGARSAVLKSVSDKMNAVVGNRNLASSQKIDTLLQIHREAQDKLGLSGYFHGPRDSDPKKVMETMMILKSPELQKLRDDILGEYQKALNIVAKEAGCDKPIPSFAKFTSGQDRNY